MFIRRFMDLEVTATFDALGNGAVDAEPVLLVLLHGLLAHRDRESFASVIPRSLLMHVRTEGSFVIVNHWAAFYHDVVRESHGVLDPLRFQYRRVFFVRVELSVRRLQLDPISNVELP